LGIVAIRSAGTPIEASLVASGCRHRDHGVVSLERTQREPLVQAVLARTVGEAVSRGQ
jgi:hypothetical protein